MADVIDINSKRKPQTETTPLDDILDGLKLMDKNEIDGGIILLMKKNGECLSGYFNTSFRDEATLAKVLDLDIIYRQQAREIEGNE